MTATLKRSIITYISYHNGMNIAANKICVIFDDFLHARQDTDIAENIIQTGIETIHVFFQQNKPAGQLIETLLDAVKILIVYDIHPKSFDPVQLCDIATGIPHGESRVVAYKLALSVSYLYDGSDQQKLTSIGMFTFGAMEMWIDDTEIVEMCTRLLKKIVAISPVAADMLCTKLYGSLRATPTKTYNSLLATSGFASIVSVGVAATQLADLLYICTCIVGGFGTDDELADIFITVADYIQKSIDPDITRLLLVGATCAMFALESVTWGYGNPLPATNKNDEKKLVGASVFLLSVIVCKNSANALVQNQIFTTVCEKLKSGIAIISDASTTTENEQHNSYPAIAMEGIIRSLLTVQPKKDDNVPDAIIDTSLFTSTVADRSKSVIDDIKKTCLSVKTVGYRYNTSTAARNTWLACSLIRCQDIENITNMTRFDLIALHLSTEILDTTNRLLSWQNFSDILLDMSESFTRIIALAVTDGGWSSSDRIITDSKTFYDILSLTLELIGVILYGHSDVSSYCQKFANNLFSTGSLSANMIIFNGIYRYLKNHSDITDTFKFHETLCCVAAIDCISVAEKFYGPATHIGLQGCTATHFAKILSGYINPNKKIKTPAITTLPLFQPRQIVISVESPFTPNNPIDSIKTRFKSIWNHLGNAIQQEAENPCDPNDDPANEDDERNVKSSQNIDDVCFNDEEPEKLIGFTSIEQFDKGSMSPTLNIAKIAADMRFGVLCQTDDVDIDNENVIARFSAVIWKWRPQVCSALLLEALTNAKLSVTRKVHLFALACALLADTHQQSGLSPEIVRQIGDTVKHVLKANSEIGSIQIQPILFAILVSCTVRFPLQMFGDVICDLMDAGLVSISFGNQSSVDAIVSGFAAWIINSFKEVAAIVATSSAIIPYFIKLLCDAAAIVSLSEYASEGVYSIFNACTIATTVTHKMTPSIGHPSILQCYLMYIYSGGPSDAAMKDMIRVCNQTQQTFESWRTSPQLPEMAMWIVRCSGYLALKHFEGLRNTVVPLADNISTMTDLFEQCSSVINTPVTGTDSVAQQLLKAAQYANSRKRMIYAQQAANDNIILTALCKLVHGFDKMCGRCSFDGPSSSGSDLFTTDTTHTILLKTLEQAQFAQQK